MKRWIYFFYALILLAGILIGACGMHLYQRHRFRQRVANFSAERMAAKLAEKNSRRYQLDDQQKVKINAAYIDFFTAFSEQQRAFHRQMDGAYQQLSAQMRTVLPAANFADWQQRENSRRQSRSQSVGDDRHGGQHSNH